MIGLVLGFGGALLLDFIALRFCVKEKITESTINIFLFTAKIVAIGLAILWVSGIGFLIYYYLYTPHNLQNPKIWAKISIVAVLTVNGWFIHHKVLPILKGNLGQRLFDGISQPQKRLLLTGAVISLNSWGVPFILGMCKELNFLVPMQEIIKIYLLMIMACLIVGFIMLSYFFPGKTKVLKS